MSTSRRSGNTHFVPLMKSKPASLATEVNTSTNPAGPAAPSRYPRWLNVVLILACSLFALSASMRLLTPSEERRGELHPGGGVVDGDSASTGGESGQGWGTGDASNGNDNNKDMNKLRGSDQNNKLINWPTAFPDCDNAKCSGTLRVIAISLYGSNSRYTSGAVRNSEIVRDAFPDWQLWVYMPDPATDASNAVPNDVQETLRANGARLVVVDAETVEAVGFGMNQRFLVASDSSVHKYAVRDGDSRLLLRERWALDEWEASGQPFHLLRDHPSHSNFYINGGLWGGVKGAVPNMRELLASSHRAGTRSEYLDDMNFLDAKVRSIIEAKGAYQHDAYSCHRMPGVGHPFPYARAGGEHAGGVYDAADNIRPVDVDILLRTPPPQECHSPQYPAEARDRIKVASLAAEEADDTVVLGSVALGTAVGKHLMLHFQKVFVDHLGGPCQDGETLAAPVIFDYHKILEFNAYPVDCPELDSAAVPQYHERIQGGATHYNAFGHGGIKYNQHLLVIEALYNGNPHVQLALALPVLLSFLANGPQNGRILVPGSAQTLLDAVHDAGLDSIATHGVMRQASREHWLRAHEGAPALYWAHHLYVAASTYAVPKLDQCGDISCARADLTCQLAQQSVLAMALAYSAETQSLLHKAYDKQPKCNVVVHEGIQGKVSLLLSEDGYNVHVFDSCGFSLGKQIKTVLSAHVLILPSNAVLTSQHLLRKGAIVLMVDSTDAKNAATDAHLDAVATFCSQLQLNCHKLNAKGDNAAAIAQAVRSQLGRDHAPCNIQVI